MGKLLPRPFALLAITMLAACSPDEWRYHPYPDVAATADVADVTRADVDDAATPTDVSDVSATDVSDAVASDVDDVADAAMLVDVTDASPTVDVVDAGMPDASPTSLRVVHAGIATLGTVSSGTLRVTHSLESFGRTCTPDRSLCVTGGIAP